MRPFKIIALFCLFYSTQSSAQQHSLYSQYIFNLFVINPAYAGEANALSANLSYRAQWVGIEGSPRTQNFGIHSPINNKNMALGIQVTNDEIGARQTPTAMVAYSYKLRLGGNKRISFGLQGGVINYQYRWQDLNYRRSNDPVAFGTNGNRWVPNFDFGIMYLTTDAYVGLSATSINNSRTIENSESDQRLNTFFNLIAGKTYRLNEKWALKPSTIVRLTESGPAQFDANLGVRYANRVWLTATYRYQFGGVVSGHCYITEKFHVGYSYDLPFNNLLSEQSGTHEIFIGFDFNIYGSENRLDQGF